ncbi:MAG: hypothetical protein J6P78_03635, partial [Lachnospiraceae bacterium]|nr:hypothetical protein [Lachnospiraceae bacterium]
ISAGKECDFKVYAPYGKYESGMRVYPADFENRDPADMPSADYSLYLPEDGEYEITLSQAPGGPIMRDTYSSLAVSLNGGDTVKVRPVSETYRAGNHSDPEWCMVALMQEKKGSVKLSGKKGKNILKIYGCEPGAVLMRIFVRKAEGDMPYSFFGPIPSFIER